MLPRHGRPAGLPRTVGWATLFVIGTDLFVLSPLLPDIAHDLGVSVPATGTTVTVFALAYLIGGPALGALADRRGRHPVLLAALAVFALANLASALAPDLGVLLVARGLAGLAASGVTPSVYALVAEGAPASQRARRLAVVTSGLLLALAVGAPTGSLLGTVMGWHGVFALLAVAAMVMLGITAAVVSRRGGRDGRDLDRSNARPHAGPRSRLAAAAVATRLRAVAPTMLWAMAVYGPYTYLGTILQETVHLGPGAIAAALVCFGVGALLGNLLGGVLADRHGGRAVSVVALLVLAAAETSVGLTVHAPPGVLLATLGIMALAAYPYFSAQQSRLLAAFPAASGALLAWNNSAMYAGIVLASAAGGTLLADFGAEALSLAAAGTALLAACFSVVSIRFPRSETQRPG